MCRCELECRLGPRRPLSALLRPQRASERLAVSSRVESSSLFGVDDSAVRRAQQRARRRLALQASLLSGQCVKRLCGFTM